MVIYSVFAKWKTRRALARGVSLAALFGAVWYGLDRPFEDGIGDLGRVAGAGLVGFSTALVDYGYRQREGEARAPWLMVGLVFLVAWLSLIAVFLVPSFFAVLNVLVESPAKAGQELANVVGRVGAPLTLPAAIVFALVTRWRWKRQAFRGSYAQVAGTVTVLGGVLGLGVLTFFGQVAFSGETPAVHPFHILVSAPLLFAAFLPPVAHLVDRIDGRLFPLPDDPTVARGPVEQPDGAELVEPVAASRRDELEETASAPPPKRHKIWDTGSADRVFSWNTNGEEEPEPELEEALPPRIGPQTDSGGLDALADHLWETKK